MHPGYPFPARQGGLAEWYTPRKPSLIAFCFFMNAIKFERFGDKYVNAKPSQHHLFMHALYYVFISLSNHVSALAHIL